MSRVVKARRPRPTTIRPRGQWQRSSLWDVGSAVEQKTLCSTATVKTNESGLDYCSHSPKPHDAVNLTSANSLSSNSSSCEWGEMRADGEREEQINENELLETEQIQGRMVEFMDNWDVKQGEDIKASASKV